MSGGAIVMGNVMRIRMALVRLKWIVQFVLWLHSSVLKLELLISRTIKLRN